MKRPLIGLLNFALIIFVFGSYVIVAQSVTGTWTATTKEDKADKIQVSFSRQTEKGGQNQFGSSFDYADLQGLTKGDAQNGRTNFRLVREAGTIECEGSFQDGKGSGTFVFSPNRSFADGMRSRGFDFDKKTERGGNDTPEDRLFLATTFNVTTALADDLNSANFSGLDVNDLFKAAIFKIDGKFMAEMKATGFPNLTMEDLVKARIFKIDAAFISNIRNSGFGSESFENLVKYSIFKVTPEYLNELRAEGLTDLSPEQVVKLRVFKVDAAFVRDARASDPNIGVEKIVKKKMGVWIK